MTKQGSIASFFGSGGSKPNIKKKSTPTGSKKKDNDNENKQVTTNSPAEDLIDTDDDEETQSPVPITKTQTANRSKKKRMPADKEVKAITKKRQKIVLADSSDEEMVTQDNDDDDDNADDNDDINYKEEEDSSSSSDEDDDIEIEKPLTSLKKEKPTETKSSAKQNAFTVLKQAPTITAPKSSSSSSKPNKASNAASLLSSTSTLEANTSWKQDTPASYSTLCQTLSSIDAISSRLDIQKQLTNLFRLCLIKNPADLLSLVYLASNSVAAAYECVELGIGDSLLIKAIGEASGSQSKMIKLKYEKEGDLGSVAMSSKGKQRTLGFGIKPKPLMAKEVLEVFRQIATTTGSQSQKWKISKIKGLLVRVQDPIESKYIIRSLQGKLRIGLAQSSVLVSLAHAILLSGPMKEDDNDNDDTYIRMVELSTDAKKEIDSVNASVNGDDNDDTSFKGEDLTTDAKEENKIDSGSDNANTTAKREELTTDAKNVKNLKLPLESRLEAAVNIVKKAYSEVSSFDALMEALLRAPISQLNRECRLRPGMPVEPMLAKPTKSIQEVLKRLSGKRFTCEFKYDGERAQVHMDEEGVTKVSTLK
jgi:DNA ligase-1